MSAADIIHEKKKRSKTMKHERNQSLSQEQTGFKLLCLLFVYASQSPPIYIKIEAFLPENNGVTAATGSAPFAPLPGLSLV